MCNNIQRNIFWIEIKMEEKCNFANISELWEKGKREERFLQSNLYNKRKMIIFAFE